MLLIRGKVKSGLSSLGTKEDKGNVVLADETTRVAAYATVHCFI